MVGLLTEIVLSGSIYIYMHNDTHDWLDIHITFQRSAPKASMRAGSADGCQRPSACTFTNHDHVSFLIASTTTIVSLAAPCDEDEKSRAGS